MENYINKNNGSLAKIFNTTKNGKSVFQEFGLDIKSLAKQKDRNAANKTIMEMANSNNDFANKLIDLLKPDRNGAANKIVKRARTLNSITTFAATVALVPAFLGIVLPRIVYAQTAKRQKQKMMEAAKVNPIPSSINQISMKGNSIDYKKLKHENSNVFEKMKHQ